MLTYPSSIRELGYLHRRKTYKYVDLPQLQQKLKDARKSYVEFMRWFNKMKENTPEPYSSAKMLKSTLEANLYCQWLDYYGEDAANELKQFYHEEILDMAKEIIAITMVIYTKTPFKYEKVFLSIGAQNFNFSSGDPVKDWESATKKIQEFPPDEIIYHDSCQMFVLDSNFTYVFDLRQKLVKVEHE